jgi:hypothetical protein
LQTKVKSHFNAYFWNGKGYAFHTKNGVKSSVVDDRSGAWAVLAGMVDDSKKPLVLNTLKSVYDASPYQEMYIEQAMLELNPIETLKRMRSRYSFMVTNWSSTLWEHFDTTMSNNHAWSAGPLYHLGSSILGVKPLKPAFAEYVFLPLMADLKQISGVVPSPKGNITVACTIDGDTTGITQVLNSPLNTVCIVGIPKKLLGKNLQFKTIKSGTELIWQNGTATGNVEGIEFFEEDSLFIKFKVQPGNWLLTSQSKESSTAEIAPTMNGILVFPNLTNGLVKVQFADETKNGSIKIIDMAGHTMYNQTNLYVKQGDIKKIDISGYASGAYVMTINDSYSRKIVKTESLSN